jgi:hypothetical protein
MFKKQMSNLILRKMKTLEMNKLGFSDNGIINFVNVIESVLPHTPGNWEFITIEDKLNFISNNKNLILNYLENSKPKFSNNELDPENWFIDTDENKIKMLNELQSAISTLRSYL